MIDVTEVDAQTGAVVVRGFTATEQSQRDADQAAAAAAAQAAEAEAASKAAARTALLARLGINEDEARLLLG